MFTGSSPDDLDDDPGATLVLQGNPDESGAIMHWLLGAEHSLPDWANVRSSRSIQPDPVLQPVLCPRAVSNPPGGYQYRDQLILRGLLVGACLLRSSREGDQGSETLTISLDDYALVRRLLRTELVCPTDESCDPLAVDMVNRANIYLAVKYGPEPGGGTRFMLTTMIGKCTVAAAHSSSPVFRVVYRATCSIATLYLTTRISLRSPIARRRIVGEFLRNPSRDYLQNPVQNRVRLDRPVQVVNGRPPALV